MPRALNICLDEAERLKKLPDGWVMISINGNHDGKARLQIPLDERVLSVTFDDLRQVSDVKYAGKTYEPMSCFIGRQILDFVHKNKSQSFLIHCHAGVSRSSAVALFIHLVYGHELTSKFWHVSSPNEMMVGRLMILYTESLSAGKVAKFATTLEDEMMGGNFMKTEEKEGC